MISAVLFDLDGTLIRTNIDFSLMRAEMWRMAVDAGVAEELLAGGNILEMTEIAAKEAGGSEGERLQRAMWARLEEVEADGCADPQLIRGASELWSALRVAGVKTAIVTRNCRAVSLPMVERFGLIPDVFLSRDDVSRVKPDPEHLATALKMLEIPASESAMVGDHWMDMQAGKDVGCAATVGVLGDRDRSWFDRRPPTYIVKDLAEVAKLLAV